MARTTVADVLVDGLARAGAARVFATADAPVALADAAARRGLDVFAAPDAPAAGVLAAVTGEVSAGPGALVAGLGDAPGLVRGLAHGQRDRAPVIVVTPAGGDAVLLAPVVKTTLSVEAASAGHWIAHAANLALKDPRGPVHLVVGDDVAGEPALPVAAACRPGPLPAPDAATLDALAAALAAASRPVVVAGLECGPDDARWIRAFVETLPAPALTTVKGRGALAEPHPLALGLVGADHGVLARTDLLVLVGVDAGELSPRALPPGVPAVRIGRASWPEGPFAAEALGDLALIIEELAPAVRARPAADWDVAELDRLKRAVAQAARVTRAARLVALAREASPAGVLATGDVPALAAWQAFAPRETLAPLGPATPGYAVTAALAAQLAHPARRVIAFTTRASITAGEPILTHAATLGLPLVVVALDPIDDATPARLARAGLQRFLAPDEAHFSQVFSEAFLSTRPALVALTD
jgi:acetolactate synthase I/II/III large subunit